MQSASAASVSTRARLSIVPSMRPLAAASRMASGVGVTAGQALDGLAVVVAEGGHDACQLVVGGGAQGPIEQPERLQAGLHLVHGPRRYRPSRHGPTGRGPRSEYLGPMATVTLEGVNKVYDNGYHAIHDLAFDIEDGEFLVLVGPSGCGKSTALRMIAGLETITSGEMRIGDRVVNDVEPKDRDIAMVFQNYALYPHMTVFDNIGFALKLAHVPKEEINTRVRKAASILELESYLDRKPGQLSGGQRQRVAMGRAIVRQPAAFLMDEPLSNLDAKLRVQMRAEIARLQRDLGVTTFYVTHDQVEAMTMGDRVAVIKDGFLQQVDTPQNLYDSPTNVFVAAFIGSPSMNLYEGTLAIAEQGATVKIGSQVVGLPPETLANRAALRNYDGKRVVVGVRPEDFEDASLSTSAPADRRIKANVKLVEALGSELMVHMAIDAKRVDSGDPDAQEELPGEGYANLVARFSPRSRVRVDDDIDIVVAAENLHFFDAQTHRAIWG